LTGFDTTTSWLSLLWIYFFRSCVIGHACQNNCFFLLLSWLPTYFHDTFPDAKVILKNILWFCLKNEPLWLVNHRLNVRRFSLDSDCYSIRKFVMQYVHICHAVHAHLSCSTCTFVMQYMHICHAVHAHFCEFLLWSIKVL